MQQYSDIIKQHYHHPRNTGKLSNPTHTAEQLNPLCGDEIKVYLNIKDGIVLDIKYEARGCMISIAAASVLSEYLKGESVAEIKKITKEDINKLLGVTISKARESCATLALEALKKISI